MGRPPGLVYSEAYYANIGLHVFPMQKFRMLRDEILQRELATEAGFVAPPSATREQIARVHDEAYIEKLLRGTLTPLEEAILELPYSKPLVDASFLCAGGSILAARLALERGAAVNLGGGFHHAFADHGEGFCVLNDVAIAIRDALHEGTIGRAAVIDVDVHQGNGTAAIFREDAAVFTFSIHEEDNYPLVKPPSDQDIGLDRGTGGAVYLAALAHWVPRILDTHRPDLIAYVAGADPFEEDQLGGLRLTREDLRARDRLIFDAARERSVPVVAFLAGGYARRVEDTVAIHADMVEELFRSSAKRP